MEIITLNLVPKGITPVCHASQFDIGRTIRLAIVDELHGYIFSDEKVELRVRKPDDNVVTASVEVTSGNAYVDIVTTEQMTACEGVNKCELRITKGGVRIGSLNFDMKVEVDPLKDGIESETEIHNLETQIREIDEELLPDMVAEEVANQYDSQNVIFDDHPIAGHGTGYVVKSENVPDELNDLDDVDISGQAQGEALVWDSVNNKWVNGTVSTVGGLNDLNDVTIDDTSLADKQELVYNGTEEVFENKTTRVELTQAEYDALANPLPDVDYYITDAPSMQGTSADLSYDGGTDSTYDVIEEVKGDVADLATVATSGDFYDLTTKPIRKYFVTSSSPVTLQGQITAGYATFIIIGFAEGLGGVALVIEMAGGNLSKVINLLNGQNFSSTHLSFSGSNSQLTISTDLQATVMIFG